MAKVIGLSQVERLGDLSSVDGGVTEAEVAEWCGEDSDRFSFLVVAEASLSRVPDAVTWWLTSRPVRQDWLEELWLQEGRHQMAWLSQTALGGPEAEGTRRADRRLVAIRQRRAEAHWIAGALRVQVGRDVAEARALRRLRKANLELVEGLEVAMNPGAEVLGEVASAGAARLLGMSDEAFRNYVAEDVQGRVDGGDLAHPAVHGRWLVALNELGVLTCEVLGVESPRSLIDKRFVISDQYLREVLEDPALAGQWADRLTFLAHLRTRLAERRQLARRQGGVRYERWWRLVDDQLIATLSEEYEGFLEEAREQPEGSPVPLPPHPGVFKGYAEMLAGSGWDVRWIFDGHRVWLDAQRDDSWRRSGRLVVTASRSRNSVGAIRKGQGHYRWRPREIEFVFYSPISRRYLLLTGPDAAGALAKSSSRTCPDRFVKQVVPQTWQYLKAFVPPDGLRWRSPYPPDVSGTL